MGDNPLLLIKEKKKKENPSRGGGIVDAMQKRIIRIFSPPREH